MIKTELTEEQLRALIRSVLQEMLAPVVGQPSPQVNVLPLRRAFKTLGYHSYDQIYEDVNSGLLRIGHEIEDRRRPGVEKRRLYVNVEAAKKRLAALPDKRRHG